MKMDLERVGARSRHRGDSGGGAGAGSAESEALDQIAKEVRTLTIVSGSFSALALSRT